MTLRPGAIVGGYRVMDILGSGGMGTVYLAQNPILPRRDALKVLSADLSTDDEFRARFEREANLAAALDHPNLVAVYNRGEEDGQLWIAMQYVDGTDASEEVTKGPSVMTPQRALRIVSEIGKGLDYAHRRGLLHRDVKPANFLLSAADEGDEERVLLTDFGVAKAAEDGRDLTETGNFLATVAYAPPEQLMGARLDPRADVYSLGCSFFKLLTGRNPYPATVPAVVMMGHLHEPPPRPSAVRPGLPPALDAVIAKVMAKNPAQRYATCREFAQAAEAALYGTPSRFQAPAAPPTDPRTAITGPNGSPSYAPGFGAQPTDQHLVSTVRNTNGAKRSRTARILGFAALAAVVAIAIAAGVFFLRPGDSGAGGGNGDELASVRNSHPEFSGKTVAAMNYGNGTLSAALLPSPQAQFLQDIGFRYSTDYKAVGAEKSPRSLSVGISSLDVDSDVIVVLRTDKDAGNGGFRGLPAGISNSSARIVVVDDLATVQAFQVWTDQSTGALIDKMVPVIAKALRK